MLLMGAAMVARRASLSERAYDSGEFGQYRDLLWAVSTFDPAVFRIGGLRTNAWVSPSSQVGFTRTAFATTMRVSRRSYELPLPILLKEHDARFRHLSSVARFFQP